MKTFIDRKRCCVDCTHWVNDTCQLGVPLNVIEEPETFVCARNEIRPPDPEPYHSPGFFTRGWFDDKGMVAEAVKLATRACKSLDLESTDVVMDLGAHIGSFGCEILRRRPKVTVIFVEADPINWPMIDLNTQADKRRVQVLKLAAVGNQDKRITLWRTGYVGCSSVIWRKRTYRVHVPAVNFTELLDTYQPTVLKCDVEGAEHAYDWTRLPDSLKRIHVEIHQPDAQTKGDDTLTAASHRIYTELSAQGFILIDTKMRMAFTSLEMIREIR